MVRATLLVLLALFLVACTPDTGTGVNDNGVNALWRAVLIFDGDLRLPVGPQVFQHAVLSHLGHLANDRASSGL